MAEEEHSYELQRCVMHTDSFPMEELEGRFNQLLSRKSTEKSMVDFKRLLNDGLEKRSSMKRNETEDANSRNFLRRSGLQSVLAKMLRDILTYDGYLRAFIETFQAENERIAEYDSFSHFNAPLHYAVTQLNSEFVTWLLAREKIDVNIRNSQGSTALARLCVQLSDSITESRPTDELDKIRNIMKQLIVAGADFNIYCKRVGLPLDQLLKHRESDSKTKHFIEETIEPIPYALLERTNNRLVLLNENSEANVTVEFLEIFIHYADVDQFKDHWRNFIPTTNNVKKVISLLLQSAVEYEGVSLVSDILESSSAVIFETLDGRLVHRVELEAVLASAYQLEDLSSCLNVLKPLEQDRYSKMRVLMLQTILHNAHNPGVTQRKGLLEYALDLTTSSDPNLMYSTDENGDTPLHLALAYGFEELALKILERNCGLLALRNHDNLTPLDWGSYRFWKSYLDKIIIKPFYDDPMVVKFDVHFLKPSENDFVGRNDNSVGDCKFLMSVEEGKKVPQGAVTEMAHIEHIAESSRLKNLLLHPVIYTFILVKWIRLCHWNYLNLLTTALTTLFFGWFSLTVGSADGPSTALWILSLIGLLVMMARELLQVCFLRMSYMTLDNLQDLANIAVMIVVLNGGSREWSSFLVISLAFQLSVLFGLVPINNLSLIWSMFKTVSQNFFLSFLLFSPIIGSFIYGFYHMYGNAPDGKGDSFNSFRTFWNACLKTLVMTTGEFEAANIFFDAGKTVLFVAFLFVGPMVILNLTNGLAVSDIGAIRKQSEIISITKRVMLIQRYERGVRYVGPLIHKLIPNPFFTNHNGIIHVDAKNFNMIRLRNLAGKDVPVPILPGLPTTWRELLLNCYIVKVPLFLTLDEPIVSEALAISDRPVWQEREEPNEITIKEAKEQEELVGRIRTIVRNEVEELRRDISVGIDKGSNEGKKL